MSPTVKNILVVVCALISGSIIVYGIENISHTIYPPPPDLDPSDMESLKSMMKNAPAGSLSIILLGHAAGALFSGWVIGRFAASSHRMLSMVTGLIWTFFGAINLVMIPHPLWFSVADVCVYMPLTLLGLKLMEKTH